MLSIRGTVSVGAKSFSIICLIHWKRSATYTRQAARTFKRSTVKHTTMHLSPVLCDRSDISYYMFSRLVTDLHFIGYFYMATVYRTDMVLSKMRTILVRSAKYAVSGSNKRQDVIIGCFETAESLVHVYLPFVPTVIVVTAENSKLAVLNFGKQYRQGLNQDSTRKSSNNTIISVGLTAKLFSVSFRVCYWTAPVILGWHYNGREKCLATLGNIVFKSGSAQNEVFFERERGCLPVSGCYVIGHRSCHVDYKWIYEFYGYHEAKFTGATLRRSSVGPSFIRVYHQFALEVFTNGFCRLLGTLADKSEESKPESANRYLFYS
ncbi:hypothetical protein CLF_108158, partial [Clonorchis sinensis]